MQLIQLDDVSVSLASRLIFQGVSLAIAERDRIGLVGPNGAGKSSLLKLITGELTPEQGTVALGRGVRVGYLPQQVEPDPGRTLLGEVLAPPPALAEVEAELAAIEARLEDPEVYGDEARLARSLARQEDALDRYDALGGPRRESRARELLAHLGFTPADRERAASTLSGGQKKLAVLARLALAAPDVLLLDEPDNHLDLAGKRGLEAFIRSFEGAVVIVSHDRYLLDETVERIAELEAGRIRLYVGGYSAYAAERELRRLRQQRVYTAQQKEIARIEAAIQRFELWASMVVNERHIKQARSRRKMLERMERSGELVERVRETRRMSLELAGWRGSKKSLELEGIAIGFDGAPLFADVDLLIRHGERVGLIGPNGSGKSVLFRLILGELAPWSGRIRVGPSTQIGYYAQEHQTLHPWLDRSPLELIRNASPLTEDAGVAFLLKLLFTYEQVRQPIRNLSGGERSRLQFGRLVREGPNLLLLDEPTNNLDILSAEVLEGVLEEFEGAILAISHDRYFLDRSVDRVVELDAGRLESFDGGYTDYVEKRTITYNAGEGVGSRQ